MKKIGGKKFNRNTGEWEYEPIRYVEFHCTPKEWEEACNSKYLLVRDYLRSIDLNDLAWKDVTVKDIIDRAVKDIISKRYVIDVVEKETRLFYSMCDVWKITVDGAPYPVYVDGIRNSDGSRNIPRLYEEVSISMDERNMITVVAGVCNAIFHLINSVIEKGEYYEKYMSGEYKICVNLPMLERIKL